MKDFAEQLEKNFAARLRAKTRWGRREVIGEFRKAITEELSMKCEDCGKTEKEVGKIKVYCDDDYTEALVCYQCASIREHDESVHFNGREDY